MQDAGPLETIILHLSFSMRPFGRRKPSLWALGLLVAGSIQNVEAVGKKEQRRLQEETRAVRWS